MDYYILLNCSAEENSRLHLFAADIANITGIALGSCPTIEKVYSMPSFY